MMVLRKLRDSSVSVVFSANGSVVADSEVLLLSEDSSLKDVLDVDDMEVKI